MGISLEICDIYKLIIDNHIKNDDINLRLNIQKLLEIKKKEDNYYESLKDNIGECMLIVDFLGKNKLTSQDTNDLLAYECISNMVIHINFMFYAENPEIYYGKVNNS